MKKADREHDLVAEELARARRVHPRGYELLPHLGLAEPIEPACRHVSEATGERVQRAPAGALDLRAARGLGHVAVRPDLIESAGSRRATEVDYEGRDPGSEKQHSEYRDDVDSHAQTSMSTIFLIANQPAMSITNHEPSATFPTPVSHSGESHGLFTQRKKRSRTIGIPVRM